MTTKEPPDDAGKGALRGIKVIDFGQYIPGALLGMLLSDQGADVIKVERPEGDPARSEAAFATWNRGKRSVVLDLKSVDGREQAVRLASTADVLIENFRPGVLERLGIGYPQVSQSNPGIVYCSLPGFGVESPHRNERGWDPIVGAATGLYPVTEGAAEPLFTSLPAASTFSAIVGAVSVAMALVERQRSGLGQQIEVPLHSAIFTAMGTRMINLRDVEYVDQFELPRLVMSNQYRCVDGRWVQNHGMYRRFMQRFMTMLGREDWLDEAMALWGKPLQPEVGKKWLARFEDLFLQRTAKEWEDAISAAGGACGMCRTIDEWMVHEHAIAGRMVEEVDDAHLGRMKQPGVVVRLRGTPGRVQGRAPLLGEHTEQVTDLWATPRALSKSTSSRPSGGPMSVLEGTRVLDLCIVLAGPTCGRALGEFGADVIKIDDPGRMSDVTWTIDVNRGKRSVLLDLKSERGVDVFWRLVETADVIVENNRKGSMARLGLSYEDVKARRPDIIYASLNAYGYDGPWAERPGWEQLAQAATGIQVRRGGRDGRPMLLPYPMNDYGTGMLGAYAVALALHERDRTGQGQLVDCGLALTACTLQSPFFLDYEGFQRNDLEGLEIRGYSALSRLYAAADEWLYLHCPGEDGWSDLTGLEAFAPLKSDRRFTTLSERLENDKSLARALGDIFSGMPRDHWLPLLRAAGISAIENLAISDFRDDPAVRRAGLVVTREHAGVGMADQAGTTAILSRTPVRMGRPAPSPGAESAEILRELRYTDREIDALVASGAVGLEQASGPAVRVQAV